MTLQVVVNHYGETELLRGTLDSVTSTVPAASVLVLDGRYANFQGDRDVTPASRDLCDDYRKVEYRRPPDDRLPFGEGTGRRPIHAKAEWVWYEQADPDAWALKIDDDERLRRFDVDPSDLDRRLKYTVSVDMPTGDTPELPRLWVPEEWTFYVDDLSLPRREYPRETAFDDLRQVVTTLGPEATWARTSDRIADSTRIRNRGDDRSRDYRASRKKQKAGFR